MKVQKLNSQLKQIQVQKATTEQQVKERDQKLQETQQQIDQLNQQLQAKKESQSLLARAASVITPTAYAAAPVTPTTGGCQTYWSGDYYLDNIIRFESGGNSCATNPGGCFGLLQACPGAPLRAACGGDPTCQIAWFQANKTGGRSWAQVWQHELDYGWW